MKKRNFLFNINRCTGCGACVVACRIENSERQGVNWRDVYTFNETHHPDAESFSLSLACNHCEIPACRDNCPALAITKDEQTGIVTVDPEKCIGCKYCTWACPYDAPRCDKKKGRVEKCDFCEDRLKDSEAPACVCSCPTNALRIEEKKEGESSLEPTPAMNGFTRSKLDPCIRFEELREFQIRPEMTAPPSGESIDQLFQASLPKPKSKITLKSEWTLLLFTTTAYILVSLFAAVMWSGNEFFNPLWFLGAGAAGMALSAVHLGTKTRAYRAIFNFKSSWLSREIFLFSTFLGMAGFFLLVFSNGTLGWATVFFGFLSLFAVDRLYQLALHTGPVNFHSAHTFLNAFYLTGLLVGNIPLVICSGSIKLGLYVYRKWLVKKQNRSPRFMLSLMVSIFRVLSGFVLPAVFLISQTKIFGVSTFFSLYGILISCVVVGDLIDRAEYYGELDVITPRKQMLIDLEHLLKNKTKR